MTDAIYFFIAASGGATIGFAIASLLNHQEFKHYYYPETITQWRAWLNEIEITESPRIAIKLLTRTKEHISHRQYLTSGNSYHYCFEITTTAGRFVGFAETELKAIQNCANVLHNNITTPLFQNNLHQ